MGDDGFGAEVVKRLGEVEVPRGVAVMDFGTGGLNLAYEVMRGYDALLILDISEQGGTPGTLYVIEADEDSVQAGIEDGDTLNPHGMDPKTMLRFVKSIGAWPGKVVVIACEPQTVAEIGFQLSESVAGALEPAVKLVLDTIAELQTDAAYQAQPAD
jgi:hydrogenase maturation protease